MNTCATDLDLRRIAERRVDARLSFAPHAALYVLVNAALAAFNLAATPHALWFYWSLLGWGCGLAAHGWAAFGPGDEVRAAAIAAELDRLRQSGAAR